MAEAAGAGQDLTPWDQELSVRVQPVISALFHDIMGPLTLIKNRVYLLRKHVQSVQRDESIDDSVRDKIGAIAALLDGVDEATHRIHRGMAVPRDAVWESVLEGGSFQPEEVIALIAEAMKGADRPEAAQA